MPGNAEPRRKSSLYELAAGSLWRCHGVLRVCVAMNDAPSAVLKAKKHCDPIVAFNKLCLSWRVEPEGCFMRV
jgi:hypothetical protein